MVLREPLADRQFPGRWIGRRRPVQWPPRSPDLTTFLVVAAFEGHGVPGENTKYGPRKKRIRGACQCVMSDKLKQACHDWERCVSMCCQCNGVHTEHVL